MGFKYKYTGKTLEQQIAMINESGLGFILSERNEISGKLKEVYDSIDVKCILVFKTSDFISHSVPVCLVKSTLTMLLMPMLMKS
jgi:hypothetical protein